MKASDKQKVKDSIELEGFDYCFIDYCSFDNIKDKEFHRLRINYINAHKALADYLGLEE